MHESPKAAQGWASGPSAQLVREGSRMPQLVQRGSSLKEILEQTSRRSSLSRVEPENQKVVRDASLAAYDLTSEALEGLLQRSTSLSQALDLIGQHDRDGDCDYCHGQRVRKTIRMMIHTLGHGGTSCSVCNRPLFEILYTPEFKKSQAMQMRRAPSRTMRQKNLTGEDNPLQRFGSIPRMNSFSQAGSFSKTVEQMIKHSYVLGKLTKADINELIHPSTTMKIEQGQVLLEQNENYDFMVGIVEGTVDIFVKNKWVGHVGSGKILGELAMMSSVPCEYTAVAATDIVCVEIWHEILQPILEESEEDWKDCLAAFRSEFVERGKRVREQKGGSSPISSPLARGGSKHWASMRQVLQKQGSRLGKSFGLEMSPVGTKKGGHGEFLKGAVGSSLTALKEGSMETVAEQPSRSPGLHLSGIEHKHADAGDSHPMHSPPRAWASSDSRPHSSEYSPLGAAVRREGGQGRGKGRGQSVGQGDKQSGGHGGGYGGGHSGGQNMAVERHEEHKSGSRARVDKDDASQDKKKAYKLKVKRYDRSYTVEDLGDVTKPARKPRDNSIQREHRHGVAKWRWKQGTTPLYIQSLEDELDSVPAFEDVSKSKAERERRQAKAQREERIAEQEGLRLRNDLPSTLSHHITDAPTSAIDADGFPVQYVIDVPAPWMCTTANPSKHRKTQPRNEVCRKWQAYSELDGGNSFEVPRHRTAEPRRAQTVGDGPRHSRLSTQQRGATTTPGRRRPGKVDRCSTALGHGHDGMPPGGKRYRAPHTKAAKSLERSETPASSRTSVEFARINSAMSGAGLQYLHSSGQRIDLGTEPLTFEILLRRPTAETLPGDPDGFPQQTDLNAGGDLLPTVEGRRLQTGEDLTTARTPEPWGGYHHGEKAVWHQDAHPTHARAHARREAAASMSSRRSERMPPGTTGTSAKGAHGHAHGHAQAFFMVCPVAVSRRPSLEASQDSITST